MPSSARWARLPPSKLNGLVTTPMVRAPASRATSATMGEAPVPVPPPMPAVTKTISAPRTASRSSSRLSSAARGALAGVAADAEALGQLVADADLHVGVDVHERLAVGVDGDELDAGDLLRGHAVDGVAATTADAEYFDRRQSVELTLTCHIAPLFLSCATGCCLTNVDLTSL